MSRGTDWFHRMGDIPGLDWTSPGVDRARLPRHNAKPRVHVFEFEGRRTESLWWDTGDGGTSGSPAQSWLHSEEEQASDVILTRLYEALELPAEPTDYHFAIQTAAGTLWQRRRENPELILEVEKLCWLDIRLAEAWPAAVGEEGEEGEQFYSITAFHTLISLYEREGLLEDALAVAARAIRFGRQVPGERDRLEAKLAAIAAERET